MKYSLLFSMFLITATAKPINTEMRERIKELAMFCYPQSMETIDGIIDTLNTHSVDSLDDPQLITIFTTLFDISLDLTRTQKHPVNKSMMLQLRRFAQDMIRERKS